MEEQYTFAKFWRCALQVNPASYNNTFRGTDSLNEEDYNQQLLNKCMALNIKIVGVADHGNVDSIDALRKLLEPNGVIVFPGFEIASTEKIHMVCLFPEWTNKDQLNRYLGSLGLTKTEERVWPSKFGCLQLAKIICEDLGGFWYAAHVTGANGLLSLNQDGGGLTHVWKDYKLVRSGQIPGAICDLPKKFKQIVVNRNPDWKRERPIAIINAKDVANPEDLESPSATCWIKMTKPNFDAFKMAFLDSESRIYLNSQMVGVSPHSKIVSLNISGGYLNGVKINFSDHLNTVIGGRGTGKSTLFECIRYVLDIPPKGTQAKKLHQDILKENLGKEKGRIEIVITSSTQHGKSFNISRRFGESPIVRDEEGNVLQQQPYDLLPTIEIYGQNEIYELAQNKQSRLQLIERFIPNDNEYEHKNTLIKKDLKDNQQNLLKWTNDVDDLRTQVAQLPKLFEQLKGFQSFGIEEKLAKASLLARENQISEQANNITIELRSKVILPLLDNLPSLDFVNDESLEGLPNIILLTPIQKSLSKLRQIFENQIHAMQTTLAESKRELTVQLEIWRKALQQEEQLLDKELQRLPTTAGKSGQEIGVAYKKLQQDIQRIKPLETKVATSDQQIEILQQTRRNLLGRLSDLRATRSDSLRSAAKRLNKKLKGKLKVEIIPDGDRSSLKTFLLNCKLEGVAEKRLNWIDEADIISPFALASSIRKGQKELTTNWKITPLVADALTKMPLSYLMELESLELSDRVEIYLNIAHDDSQNFKSLERLSTGQQCTAILHMLLLENCDPLLIDQPEDNLDNAFIAKRIVQELRTEKYCRQFLFATHNANIPVFGDAEWIGVFNAKDEGLLGFENQGSIDVPEIRSQVANILEGGRDAFVQRKEKYEF